MLFTGMTSSSMTSSRAQVKQMITGIGRLWLMVMAVIVIFQTPSHWGPGWSSRWSAFWQRASGVLWQPTSNSMSKAVSTLLLSHKNVSPHLNQHLMLFFNKHLMLCLQAVSRYLLSHEKCFTLLQSTSDAMSKAVSTHFSTHLLSHEIVSPHSLQPTRVTWAPLKLNTMFTSHIRRDRWWSSWCL